MPRDDAYLHDILESGRTIQCYLSGGAGPLDETAIEKTLARFP